MNYKKVEVRVTEVEGYKTDGGWIVVWGSCGSRSGITEEYDYEGWRRGLKWILMREVLLCDR